MAQWNSNLKHPVESELRWYEMSEINLQIGIANVNLHRTHKHISVMVLQSYMCRRELPILLSFAETSSNVEIIFIWKTNLVWWNDVSHVSIAYLIFK